MPTIKVLELVGVSEQSFHHAVESALEEANQSVRGITGLEVLNTTAKVRDGKIAEYHADVKFAFPTHTIHMAPEGGTVHEDVPDSDVEGTRVGREAGEGDRGVEPIGALVRKERLPDQLLGEFDAVPAGDERERNLRCDHRDRHRLEAPAAHVVAAVAEEIDLPRGDRVRPGGDGPLELGPEGFQRQAVGQERRGVLEGHRLQLARLDVQE